MKKKRIELDFKAYGLTIERQSSTSTTYIKKVDDCSYIEVYNAMGVITVELVNNDERFVVASRYECLSQADLNFLLTRGRVKFVFTT